MSRRIRRTLACLGPFVVAFIGGTIMSVPAVGQTTLPASNATPAADRSAFYEALDLEALGRIAVHRDGRVKTFESFAREMMSFITGPRSYEGRQGPTLYLDLMIRPEAFTDADIVYVKSKLIRTQIAEALRRSVREELAALEQSDPTQAPMLRQRMAELNDRIETRLAAFRKTGLISEPMLLDPHVRNLLARLETDLLRGAKFVRMIDNGLAVKDPQVLAGALRVVPPLEGGFEDRWLTLDEVAMTGAPGASAFGASWAMLRDAWRRADAGGVNAAAAALAAGLPAVNPALYPDARRLAWESWYFRMKNMTWVWIVYALALIPLILNVVFRWRGARIVGLSLFMVAFALHTGAVMLRWYVAERWPNTNMFEAVTTAAWFGACLAVIAETTLRRTPMRSIIAIGSGAASMLAFMAAHFLPLELNAGISNRMPVLHDVWLYIHTNIIIFSYCLIFIASISALLYLIYRVYQSFTRRDDYDGASEFARIGGAAALIMKTPDGGSYLARTRTTVGQVLDGTTMIVLELSFILLWTGLVMGAIWADHSWGRPWGWDPKEVFALNTFIIFVLLIHTRMKVRDKGLWTSLLAILGCGVMLFNWIVINFTISGLHSYA